jgi:hypothetical protein
MGATNASICSGLSNPSLGARAGELGVCAIAITGMSSNSSAVKDRFMVRRNIHASCFGRSCGTTSAEDDRSITSNGGF